MKAITVIPLKRNSIHFKKNVRDPSLDDVPDGKGVVIEILEVGTCGTDKEINLGLYGKSPPRCKYLILGHECKGRVVEVGKNVTKFKAGDIVTVTVRRPGTSIYDKIRFQDITLDERYFERGISEIHGFFCEYIVEHEEFLVRIPKSVAEVGVLMEPMSVVQKGVRVASLVQNVRFPIYEPKRALVLGAGPIGQLAALVFRLRGFDVFVAARRKGKHLKARLIEKLDATYVGTEQRPLLRALKKYGRFDIIFEATGSSKVAFEAPLLLAKNSVCIWSSITGGDDENMVPTAHINQGAVLGNQLIFGTVNAHITDFENGARDFVLAQGIFPHWLPQLLTHRIKGLENYKEMMKVLSEEKDAIKVSILVN